MVEKWFMQLVMYSKYKFKQCVLIFLQFVSMLSFRLINTHLFVCKNTNVGSFTRSFN